ncbi:MAG: HAMP domain-containing histidine kinase [Campylobacterales bacterium]|nr:HAMP domain-containing histidine kinase [Campylobacterales bacterium]
MSNKTKDNLELLNHYNIEYDRKFESIEQDISKLQSLIFISSHRDILDFFETQKIEILIQSVNEQIDKLKIFVISHEDENSQKTIELLEQMKKNFGNFALLGKMIPNDFKISKEEGIGTLGAIDNVNSMLLADIFTLKSAIKKNIKSNMNILNHQMENVRFILFIVVVCVFILSAIVQFRISSLEKINNILKDEIDFEITKRKKQEELLIQQSRNAAVGETVNAIAYHWQQPLNVIAICVQEIQEELLNENYNKQFVDKMLDTSFEKVMYLSQTVSNFRNFFDDNKVKTKTFFNVYQVFNETMDILSVQLLENDIKVIDKIDSEIDFYGYENEFRQIIFHIIKNSIEAIQKRKSLKNSDNGFIEISILKNENELFMEFLDNGGGIDSDILEKIFNPFEQRTSLQVVGLNLFMIKIIVERYLDGTISLVNKDDGLNIFIKVTETKSHDKKWKM